MINPFYPFLFLQKLRNTRFFKIAFQHKCNDLMIKILKQKKKKIREFKD